MLAFVYCNLAKFIDTMPDTELKQLCDTLTNDCNNTDECPVRDGNCPFNSTKHCEDVTTTDWYTFFRKDKNTDMNNKIKELGVHSCKLKLAGNRWDTYEVIMDIQESPEQQEEVLKKLRDIIAPSLKGLYIHSSLITVLSNNRILVKVRYCKIEREEREN